MSLAAILSVIQLVPSLFTVIDNAVVSVEQTLAGVSGSQKLQAALTKVSAFLQAAGVEVSTIASLGGVLTPLVNAAVAIFNATGIFGHSAAVSTTAAAPKAGSTSTAT